jgi:hypothetical protein
MLPDNDKLPQAEPELIVAGQYSNGRWQKEAAEDAA